MRRLLHMPFDPACRFIRLTLAEKGLPAQLIETPPWEDDASAIVPVNPAGEIPVLIDKPPTGGTVNVAPAIAIAEYLEDAYSTSPLMPSTSAARAETRRLCMWFLQKFESEVCANIVRESIDRRLMRAGLADYSKVKGGKAALSWHLDYLSWLLESRPWLAGEKMSYADLAAAAHISTLDYLAVISWDDFETIKDWYAKTKSRPSFRPLLNDRIEGMPPPPHYANLDF